MLQKFFRYEKSNIGGLPLHILSIYLYPSLSRSKAHAHCFTIICGLSGFTTFFNIISQTSRFSDTKYVFWILLQILPVTFLILSRIQRDIIINMYMFLCKVLVILDIFLWNSNFLNIVSKNPQILNFMKIRPAGAEFFHVDRQTHTDRQTWRS